MSCFKESCRKAAVDALLSVEVDRLYSSLLSFRLESLAILDANGAESRCFQSRQPFLSVAGLRSTINSTKSQDGKHGRSK